MGGVAALPSSVSQVPGKCLFIFGEASQREEGGGPRARGAGFDTVKGLSCGKGIKEVSIPVYDPNRGGLDPRELNAILLVVFAKTEKIVHLNKKYYLSLAWVSDGHEGP